MEVKMQLKDWKVKRSEKDNAVNICGDYVLLMNDKAIAKSGFNDGYSDQSLPFSGDLIKKCVELEKEIIKEIQSFLS